MKPVPRTTQVRLVDLRDAPAVDSADAAAPVRALRRLAAERRGFLALVVLPTLLAVLYFGLIAADRYASELRYVVRSPSTSAAGQLSGLLQATGSSRGAEDAHAINAFMTSRDAMRDLVAQAGLRQAFATSRADPFSRFPSLFGGASDEDLFKYFQRMVTVKFDKSTGITSVEVQAFSPEHALRIATVLIERAEALSNRLTERIRTDLLRTADEEVERARQRSLDAHAALTAFRNREAIVDPTRYSVALVETIAKLSLELAQMRAQLVEIQRASPQNPQINALNNRIAAFNEQIAAERRNLAGSAASLAPRIAEYERLQIEREFADRLFASSVSSLEGARLDAQRQQIYVERIVQPQATDYPAYPYRILSILSVFAVLTLGYRILLALVTNLRKHAPQGS
ncbi:MAG: capsule biosynthesis protein [Rhizobiales bacterium]|nr:capsule biosynthesis protein [Hyphomicrobiales bacterium]